MQEKRRCNYVFHNPNTKEEMERFFNKWLVEINLAEAESFIREQAETFGQNTIKNEEGEISK